MMIYCLQKGKKDEMMGNIQKKLGKTKEEIHKALENN